MGYINYYFVIEPIVNVLRVLLIRKLMGLFLAEKDGKRALLNGAYGAYFLITTVLYIVFGVSAAYEAGCFAGLFGLMLLYDNAWERRIWAVFSVFFIDMACMLVAVYMLSDMEIAPRFSFQVFLLLICVALMRCISSHGGYSDIEMELGRGQTLISAAIPTVSAAVLCALRRGNTGNTVSALICVSMLVINIGVFYLCHMMAENYRQLHESGIYRQQTYAYQNQLDIIMESQGRIRALRHDMKNHILALELLLQRQEWSEAKRYLSSMQGFMENPAEYATTGNDAVDSLLNYKLRRAKEMLNTVETKINIPEKLILHSFDLNVVLGNLLDNAIDAAAQTDEKRLRVEIKLDRGILFINMRNSCRETVSGHFIRLETTKADAANHGIGLGNVRRIVEKYHGDMDMACEAGGMEIDIIMYVDEL